jgi:hypothetical protein
MTDSLLTERERERERERETCVSVPADVILQIQWKAGRESV